MSLVDKDVQRVLLETLRERSYNYISLNALAKNAKEHPKFDEAKYGDNILEFNFRDLIVVGMIQRKDFPDENGGDWSEPKYRITQKGINYLDRPCWVVRILKFVGQHTWATICTVTATVIGGLILTWILA